MSERRPASGGDVAEAFTGQLTRVDRRGDRTSLVDPVDGQFTAGVDALGNRISYTLSRETANPRAMQGHVDPPHLG